MDEFAGGNYDAEEQIAAFYAMIVDKLGDDVTLIAGARFESTSINYILLIAKDFVDKETL